MEKFYCYGAKDFCDCTILCIDCCFADGSGGEYRDVQVPDTKDESHKILPTTEQSDVWMNNENNYGCLGGYLFEL